MLFNTYGNKENPVIIMLTGSFCPGETMEYLYSKLCKDFYIIVPTYNGHHKNSKDFTTRQNEAKEIKDYIISNKISTVKMIYGQSMGSEVGIELMCQLRKENITVQRTLFDGAPCIKLSKPYKAFMHFKFKTLINTFRDKTLEDVKNLSIIKKFTANDPDSLHIMIEPIVAVAPFITKATIKNEVECCYTFDFPAIPNDVQKNMHFFYDANEKAYKTCIKGLNKAYPNANYKVVKGYGHLTYSCKHTEEYIDYIKNICK